MPSIRCAAALALGLAFPAGAEIYRWVDADGTPVYSQTPPPAGSSTLVRPQPGPAGAERQRAEERLRGMLEQDVNRREDRALAQEKAQKEREAEATRAANCATARKNLAVLEQYGRTPVQSPDGQILTLSEDDLAARLRETRARIEADCR